MFLKDHKELKGHYKQIKTSNRKLFGDNKIHYKRNNSEFLQFYYDQLREKDHPGILCVEEAIRRQNEEAHRQEMERLEAVHRVETQQAARKGNKTSPTVSVSSVLTASLQTPKRSVL